MASPSVHLDSRYMLRPEYDTVNEFFTTIIDDVSTAGQVYLTIPFAGTVTKVDSVLNGAIATADAVLTVKDGDGNSMGTITIANSSSAAGDKDSLSPSSNNGIAAGETIEIETNGASTNAVRVFLTVTVKRTTVDS